MKKQLTFVMILMIGFFALQSCKGKKADDAKGKEVVEEVVEEVVDVVPTANGMAEKPKEKFAEFDTDKDGKLTVEEFTNHAKSEYKSKDKNGNGKIEKEECKMFDTFNNDKNDFLSEDEFVKGYEDVFAKMDANEDKGVSADEYAKFMTSMMNDGKCGSGDKKEVKKEGKCGAGKCGAGKCGSGDKKEAKEEAKK